MNYQNKQTVHLSTNNQRSQSLKEQVRYTKHCIWFYSWAFVLQILNSNNSSQSKKRKADENDRRVDSYSSKKRTKNISEHNVSKTKF